MKDTVDSWGVATGWANRADDKGPPNKKGNPKIYFFAKNTYMPTFFSTLLMYIPGQRKEKEKKNKC